MIISILKETREHEGRVALTPENVRELAHAGHKVRVQKGAGLISGFSDDDYRKKGGKIFEATGTGIQSADLILKVKEPTLKEVGFMKSGQIIFCFLHLAAMPKLLQALLRKKVTALAYETIEQPDGTLPLLKPMSEIAGKLAVQNGAHFLRADCGGRGILLGGTQTVPPANVVILGAGIVGSAALQIAHGMGAFIHVVDVSSSRLKKLRREFKRIRTYSSSPAVIKKLVPKADLLIGAVLIPGAKAPKLVMRSMVQKMKKGSVIVDVAVDQGGCVATSQVTTHDHPIVVKYGVLHYGVANIPAVVPVTATEALTQASFPYIQKLASLGLAEICRRNPEMRLAINCAGGQIVHPALLL